MGAAIRRAIIEQSCRAHVGHIGSCLSIADVMAALYGDTLRTAGQNDPDRDRFILSKGHAALALYAALREAGHLSEEELETYCADGTDLSGHPEHALAPVEFSTGSLGHGLSIGAGAALGARLRASPSRVFVLLSDAECNEGSVWEAAMFAAHHGLTNLIAIVDANGQQALGRTSDVLDLEPLSRRWAAFGWDAREVDGHDPEGLARELEELNAGLGPPHVLVARTIFGKGISYMEGEIPWHYLPMSEEQYAQALRELDTAASDVQ
ncbi:MAG: transketolase [Thermoleophilaceae bacterium]|jgi:transketolase|nr:transketolase [Thermoleophilaceae bacterium]